MIVAQFVGGPRDGDEIALKDVGPLRIPLMPAFSGLLCEDTLLTEYPTIRYIELRPQLTANGWRLYWTERPS